MTQRNRFVYITVTLLEGNNSPAQRLSKLLPNQIIASTDETSETLYSDKSGKVVKSTIPQPINGGKWQTFQGGKANN